MSSHKLSGRRLSASALVSEVRTLLPGIARKEILHEQNPPLDRMFKNFVLKELVATNGIYAIMIDNLKHITVIEQFMEQPTLVSYRIKLLLKQSKHYWMQVRISWMSPRDPTISENVARVRTQQQPLMSF
jgi:hypothetical protein